MKINKKKIFIGVVLVVIIAVAIAVLFPTQEAKAEGIKVKGSIEQTYKSIKDGTSGLGQETNVTFSGKKDLGDGLVASGAIRLEDSAIDKSSIKLAKNGFAIEFGADTGDNIHDDINPRVDDHPADAGRTSLSKYQYTSFAAHDVQHVGLSYDVGMGAVKLGKVTLNYAPSNNPISAGDGSTTDAGGSATEILFKGNLGIPGASFLVGREIVESDTSSAGDQVETVYGASHTIGKLAYGVSYRTFDDETSSTEVDKSLAYSAAYSISDKLSGSVERIESSRKTAGTVDEEVMSYTLGYNLGGMGVAVQYVTTDNHGGTAGTDNEALQVRTVFKF